MRGPQEDPVPKRGADVTVPSPPSLPAAHTVTNTAHSTAPLRPAGHRYATPAAPPPRPADVSPVMSPQPPPNSHITLPGDPPGHPETPHPRRPSGAGCHVTRTSDKTRTPIARPGVAPGRQQGRRMSLEQRLGGPGGRCGGSGEGRPHGPAPGQQGCLPVPGSRRSASLLELQGPDELRKRCPLPPGAVHRRLGTGVYRSREDASRLAQGSWAVGVGRPSALPCLSLYWKGSHLTHNQCSRFVWVHVCQVGRQSWNRAQPAE